MAESKKDRIESTLTTKYLLGIVAGWNQAAAWLREEATAAFGRQDDKAAFSLRTMAAQAAEKAVEARGHMLAHEKQFAQMTQEDWK